MAKRKKEKREKAEGTNGILKKRISAAKLRRLIEPKGMPLRRGKFNPNIFGV